MSTPQSTPLPDYRDLLLVGTPFRGLVRQGPFCLCAYLGVPEGHWLAEIEDLEFPCHFGVTFTGWGPSAGLPEGWYWYGWDYGHFLDRLQLPPEVLDVLPAEALKLFQRQAPYSTKAWTVAEVEQELFDSAVYLLEQMNRAQALAQPSSRLKASE